MMPRQPTASETETLRDYLTRGDVPPDVQEAGLRMVLYFAGLQSETVRELLHGTRLRAEKEYDEYCRMGLRERYMEVLYLEAQALRHQEQHPSMPEYWCSGCLAFRPVTGLYAAGSMVYHCRECAKELATLRLPTTTL